MKIDLAILAAYAALLAFVAPSNAPTYLIVAALLGTGITWLTRAKHFHTAFQWFRTRPFRGVALAGLVAVFVLLPFALAPLLFGSRPLPFSELPAVLVTSPLTLLWFWLFLAAGARIDERRIDKLVERRLAESQRAGTASSVSTDR